MADIDLSTIAAGTGGFVMNGQCAEDRSGFSVAGAGDVNGDGLADLIVGAYLSGPAGRPYAGRSYVVFGNGTGTAINLSAVDAGTGGFVINGQCAGDRSGRSVAAAGDVNGDGLADLIVGADTSQPAAGANAGRSYVVFGKNTGGDIDLSAIDAGTGGFVINGQCAGDRSGRSVAAAGDVNGDGLGDLIVGADRSDPAAGYGAGRSYVVFGKSTGSDIDLSAVAAGSGGFVVNGQCGNDYSGGSVAGAGDVNGDGLADLIVGAHYGDPAAGDHGGRSYVVFGKSAGSGIDLSAVAAGTGGFVINAQYNSDDSGYSVAGAGDVNGDGLADLIVGAIHAHPVAGRGAGRSYVVFGKNIEGAIDLSTVAHGNGGGFVINGHCEYDYGGLSVASAGDINGDGLADLIVGAPRGDPAGGSDAGRSYVVFGKSGTGAVDLSAVADGTGGFVINGQCEEDYSGISVAGAGDVNGDGLADLIVGAHGSDPAAGNRAGRSYVIFGSTTGAFTPTAVDQLGGSGSDTLTGTGGAETLVGGAGNDILTGNGGTDVLYGGAGNDFFVLDADNVASLGTGFDAVAGRLARVDGGSGLDTLQLSGTGIALDLTAIASQGASTPGSASRLESIERIDLTGSGNNTLTVGYSDMLDLAGTNLINSGTRAALGWTDGSNGGGTYTFAEREEHHQLIVDGNAGDAARMSGGDWDLMGTVTHDGDTYTVYNSVNGLAQVLIADAVTSTVQLPPIDLSTIAAGTGGFVMNGECQGDTSGWSVAGAGDVNGDGLGDLIVGAYHAHPAAGEDAGRSYVVFGKTATGFINLSAVAAGSGGFVIDGACEADNSGSSVAGAGDVNGDGLADLIVGARSGTTTAGEFAGRSYVVFGRAETGAVNLSAVALGDGGFVINGQCEYDYSGYSVAGAGDVNGDGLADLIVGAYYGDPAGREDAGRSYVVFGKSGSSAVELSAVAAGSGGFVINGECEEDYSGFSVAGAGDVNGDGLADLIVGATQSDPAGVNYAGRTYVVFGRSGSSAIELSAVAAGTGGFVMNGECEDDGLVASVAGAGDVNGDGLADLIIGEQRSGPGGRSYVVFGGSGTGAIDLSAVAAGSGGFVINGECQSNTGSSVAGAGDINGDGLADLIVGAPTSDPAAGSNAGRSYVIFGRTGGGAVELSAVADGTGGFVINGQCAQDDSGSAVAGAGDINGDGLADLVLGVYRGTPEGADPASGFQAGRSYVIFGSTTGAFAQTAVDQLGGDDGDVLQGSGTNVAETFVGGAGHDTLIGNGGADVLYGGSGSDSFILNESNIAALSAPFGAEGNTTQLARIDGGTETDILMLDGANIAFDLSAVAQQGGSTPLSTSRLEGIEGIDLTGSGNNAFTLALADVLDLSESTNTFRVNGNAGDAVTITNAGSTAVGSITGYHQFTRGGVTLEVDKQVAITLRGAEGGDVLTGTSSADTILGLSGDDEIAGNGGNDTLEGAAGNDALNGGSGNDTLNGGTGNDTLTGGSNTDTASYAGVAGALTLRLTTSAAQNTGGAGRDTLNGIENLTGGSGNDTLTGNDSANRLDGGSGNDTLAGGNGNDTLDGAGGTDKLTGGAGNDTYVVNTASDKLTETAPGGTDLVQSTATSYRLADHVENLTLLGSGNISGTGNAEDNVITGNTGRNSLDGSSGDDTLSGGSGNDTLVGGSGADTMSGGSGNDVLRGLSAADVLTGGSGADRFDFDAVGDTGTTSATRDRITDFTRSQGDKIDLSTIDANGSSAGNGKFTFIGGAAFSGNSRGKLRYDAAADVLYGSTDADTAAEFSIRLPNLSNMVAGDFIL